MDVLDWENPDVLRAHRELQLLRAAGVAGSHRRRGKRRRIKPVNKDSSALAGWVDARHRKLEATS